MLVTLVTLTHWRNRSRLQAVVSLLLLHINHNDFNSRREVGRGWWCEKEVSDEGLTVLSDGGSCYVPRHSVGGVGFEQNSCMGSAN